jgi:hypothetical protein
MILVITLIGLVIAVLIPRQPAAATAPSSDGVSAPETLGGQVS